MSRLGLETFCKCLGLGTSLSRSRHFMNRLRLLVVDAQMTIIYILASVVHFLPGLLFYAESVAWSKVFVHTGSYSTLTSLQYHDLLCI